MTAQTSKPPRTLADIKTFAGRAGKERRGYANFFQMGALELERWRRGKEREAASNRVAEIDRRMAEIDQEMSGLLEECGIPARESKDTPQRRKSGGRQGLRIRY